MEVTSLMDEVSTSEYRFINCSAEGTVQILTYTGNWDKTLYNPHSPKFFSEWEKKLVINNAWDLSQTTVSSSNFPVMPRCINLSQITSSRRRLPRGQFQ
jgi:hypothetical protein